MATLEGRLPIFYPAPGSPLTPLENLFLEQANSIKSLLIANHFSVAASSQAERDALFPTPAQGDRCFRSDLGYEQVYYAAYNAASNPGGMRSAGWARFDARVQQSGFFSGSTDSIGDVTVNHRLPVTPGSVQLTGVSSGVIPGRLTYTHYSLNETNFKVRVFRQDTGGAFIDNPVNFSWTANIA